MRDASWTTEHVGEWRVALHANTLPGLAAELARVIARAAGRATGTYGAWEPLVIIARDHEALLVDFANELVSRGEIAGRAYDDLSSIVISRVRGSAELRARVRGRPVKEWRSPIKAATYHGTVVEHTSRGWKATVLFDV